MARSLPGFKQMNRRTAAALLALGVAAATGLVSAVGSRAITYAYHDPASDYQPRLQPLENPVFLEQLAVVDHELMGDMRGGFVIGGLEIEFGVNIRTFIDGVLALETVVNVTDGGRFVADQINTLLGTIGASTGASSGEAPEVVITHHDVPDAPASTADTAGSQVASNSRGGSVPAPVIDDASLGETRGTGPATSSDSLPDGFTLVGDGGTNLADADLPGVDLAGLSDALGVTVNDEKGVTAALVEVTDQAIKSVVANRASGRDIRQDLNINVTVANYRAFEASAREAMRSRILSQTLARIR